MTTTSRENVAAIVAGMHDRAGCDPYHVDACRVSRLPGEIVHGMYQGRTPVIVLFYPLADEPPYAVVRMGERDLPETVFAPLINLVDGDDYVRRAVALGYITRKDA